MTTGNESRDHKSQQTDRSGRISRRKMLSGAAATGSLLLAGCSGDGGDGGGDGGSGNGGSGDGGSGDGGSGDSTATDTSTESTETARVGFLTHLTGRFGFAGQNMKNATDLAIKMIEEAGGTAGADVELITYDSKAEPQRAVTGFEKLLADDVDVIIGPSSASIPNLMPLAEENEMPIIAITSGTTFLDDKGGEYIWRVTPSDSLLGRPQPLYAIEQGWDKMAVAHLDNKGSQSFARSVASFHESQGGEVVKEVALPPAASSYRSEISSLVDADPDVIHVTASENGFPLFLTNYREQGIDIPLMGGNEVTQDTIIEQVGADAIEGVYGIANVPGENYNAFVENYEGEYDESPGIFAPEAYDAMNLLGLAWERAGAVGPQELIDNIRPVATPDGTQVIDYPSGKEELDADSEVDYEGAATPCNFDEDGDVYGSMAVMQATDGEWVETKVYDSSDLRTDN